MISSAVMETLSNNAQRLCKVHIHWFLYQEKRKKNLQPGISQLWSVLVSKCLQCRSCSPNYHTHLSAFLMPHRFPCALILTYMLHSFISEYQGTAGLCYLEANDFFKIISLLLNFLVRYLYPCSTMRQIWQGLPNLGCNNQSMTSWKRTTGIWRTPKQQLSDSTATLYSSKGRQPGKVSSLWPRLSPRLFVHLSSIC